MKTVGIIGGLSPESTITYYRGLNEGVRERLGGQHSAKILLASVDFGQFVALKDTGDWEMQGEILANCATALERAGADLLIMATNTMHKLAGRVQESVSIPFLHLADATAERICGASLKKVGLLGTRYTMEEDFYKDRLTAHGLEVFVPDAKGREAVNRVIYEELCNGTVCPESRKLFQSIIMDLEEAGAEAVILGCTEISMLIRGSDTYTPLFDTTRIHIEKALQLIFEI